jgi:hypothetical protein
MSKNNYKKCEKCNLRIIGFSEEDDEYIKENNINIINDICNCPSSPYKYIDFVTINNSEIIFGTVDEIINKILNKFKEYINFSNYYLSTDDENYNLPSPFSNGNNINNIIPFFVTSLFKNNIKDLKININKIPDTINFEDTPDNSIKIVNLSYF